MYQTLRVARNRVVPIRKLRCHLNEWGDAGTGRPPLVLLHGWMDVGASFQFVVDAMACDRWVIAPDWRGFGDSTAPDGEGYWFPDYLADLDALLDLLSPDAPVDLVGHSMGGNVAMLYAGVRPQRVRRLVNLEGFGLPATRPAQAPGRMARWLDELRQLRAGALALKDYDDAEAVARRLMKTNPRLRPDRAAWLARQWARPGADGRWRVLGDAAHKLVSPLLYHVEETLAIWSCITAPVLAVEADGTELDRWWQGQYTLAEYHERLKVVPQLRRAVVADAGHMLHHDQPEAVAALIDAHCAVD